MNNYLDTLINKPVSQIVSGKIRRGIVTAEYEQDDCVTVSWQDAGTSEEYVGDLFFTETELLIETTFLAAESMRQQPRITKGAIAYAQAA